MTFFHVALIAATFLCSIVAGFQWNVFRTLCASVVSGQLVVLLLKM